MGDTTPGPGRRPGLLVERDWLLPFEREADPSWRLDAACIGMGDLFFIDRSQPARPAKALCAECPVIQECLEYALTNSIREGIWGGLSERERRKEKQQRARAAI